MEQTRQEVERCAAAFERWLARRRGLDARSQYATQLRSIELVIEESLGLMRGKLDAISDADTTATTYEECLRVDRQLVWARRFWDYFRDKWDQRDDPETGAVLAAADEIVWSCFVPPLRRPGQPSRPAPLPFIAAEFSPHAIPRRQPPQSLRPSDKLLWEVLAELPLPVVGLPRLCVANPWWMILISHELGHQVLHELGDEQARAAVAAAAASAAAAAGALADERWSAWAHELFADAFAGAQVGAAHAWALAELELGAGPALLKPTPGYPPGVVRQAVAVELLRRLGLGDSEALPGLPALPALDELIGEAGDRERARALLAAVPGLAAALATEPLVAGMDLRALTAFEQPLLSRAGRVGRWQRRFAGAAAVRPEATPEAARLAVAGAFGEWAAAVSEPDEDSRWARTERLRERMLEVLPQCREPGVRAPAPAPATDVAALARRVALEAHALPAEEPEAPLPGPIQGLRVA